MPAARRAIELFRSVDDPAALGAALWRGGCALLSPDTSLEADVLFGEAERILRKQGASKWLVLTLIRRASVCNFQKRYDAALPFYQEAIAIARTLKYPFGTMLCSDSLGDHLFGIGQREEALSLLTTTRDELPRGLRSQLLSTLATHFVALDRGADACDALAEAIALGERVLGTVSAATSVASR